jgi:hypothetical protein
MTESKVSPTLSAKREDSFFAIVLASCSMRGQRGGNDEWSEMTICSRHAFQDIFLSFSPFVLFQDPYNLER